jgi:hypothetical protein
MVGLLKDKMVALLYALIAMCTSSQVSVKYDNGSLNIVTVNGTVMVDQLDLKQAIASLRSELNSTKSVMQQQQADFIVINANLSSELSASQSVISQQSATIKIIQNHISQRYFAGPQLVISTTVTSARSVYATDLDNDGDMDVLSASRDDDKIAWYRNDGSGSFSSQLVISKAADAARSVYAADVEPVLVGNGQWRWL